MGLASFTKKAVSDVLSILEMILSVLGLTEVMPVGMKLLDNKRVKVFFKDKEVIEKLNKFFVASLSSPKCGTNICAWTDIFRKEVWKKGDQYYWQEWNFYNLVAHFIEDRSQVNAIHSGFFKERKCIECLFSLLFMWFATFCSLIIRSCKMALVGETLRIMHISTKPVMSTLFSWDYSVVSCFLQATRESCCTKGMMVLSVLLETVTTLGVHGKYPVLLLLLKMLWNMNNFALLSCQPWWQFLHHS